MHVVEYQRQTCEMNVENEKHADVNLGQNQLNFYPVSYEKTETKGRFLAQTHRQLSARKAPKKHTVFSGSVNSCVAVKMHVSIQMTMSSTGESQFCTHTDTLQLSRDLRVSQQTSLHVYIGIPIKAFQKHALNDNKKNPALQKLQKHNFHMFGTPWCRQFTAAQGGPGTPDSREKLSVQLK